MTATLVLSDDNGAVALQVVFSGGFKDDSLAHQAALILVKLMDEHCERQGQPKVVATQDPPPPSTDVVWTGELTYPPAIDRTWQAVEDAALKVDAAAEPARIVST